MNPPTRLPVFWCGRPDEESNERPYISVRFVSDELAVDSDQLIALVELTERDGQSVEPRRGFLKQYGGDSLRSDLLEGMMKSDVDGLEDTEWLIQFDEALGFTAEMVP